MARYRCLCTDIRCVTAVPKAAQAAGASEDDLTYPISIKTVVGYGGKNDPDDVRIVQTALNRISAPLGGPVPKLKVDGIVGPKTNDAIIKFQKRQTKWVNGKVEPDKAVIRRLNEMIFTTIFVELDQKTMDKLYADFLPEARRCVLAADAALLAAQQALNHPSGLKPSQSSVDLVNKHFQLDKNPGALRALSNIQSVFRSMAGLMHQNLTGQDRTFIPFPGRIDMASVFEMRVLALSTMNGVNRQTEEDKRTAMDGASVILRPGKVMMMPVYRFSTRDLQICTLIHELAHYLGPKEGNPDAIDDPPGGSSSSAAIAKLRPVQRPRIAECYSNFAFEAKFHREPMKLIA